jgi:lipopolysaccharide/colanic/teichoic acid biosynthesis glycosyltransferase
VETLSSPAPRPQPELDEDAIDLSLPLRIDSPAATARVTARVTSSAWAVTQRLAALAGCILLSPLFAVMYVAVRTTSPGPFLFSQQRPGRGGKPFMMLKVRTMRVGSEAPTALGTARGDARITAVGRWLRDLKLDELPQLWNVVRGDMELVGPRPLPRALDEELRKHIPDFERRYEVTPGLTNVSQVAVLDNKLGERLVEDWQLRFEGELHYIERKSFTYDVVVLAMTALFVVRKLTSLSADRLTRVRTRTRARALP